MQGSEKTRLSLTANVQKGIPTRPDIQGTTSWSKSVCFLLAARKQYYPVFSLDESDEIL